MIEATGNLWDFYDIGETVCITTNGHVGRAGTAVMGRGTAKQAASKFPTLPLALGSLLRATGNHVYLLCPGIFSFPVKHHWAMDADLYLIRRSCLELKTLAGLYQLSRVYLPRPGCGNGNLQWKDVKPVLEMHLYGDDDRFIVVWNGNGQ